MAAIAGWCGALPASVAAFLACDGRAARAVWPRAEAVRLDRTGARQPALLLTFRVAARLKNARLRVLPLAGVRILACGDLRVRAGAGLVVWLSEGSCSSSRQSA